MNDVACTEIKLEITEVIGTVNGETRLERNVLGEERVRIIIKHFSFLRGKRISQLDTSWDTQQTDKTSDSALDGANWIIQNANSIDFIHGSLSLAININWVLDNSPKFNIEFNRQSISGFKSSISKPL